MELDLKFLKEFLRDAGEFGRGNLSVVQQELHHGISQDYL